MYVQVNEIDRVNDKMSAWGLLYVYHFYSLSFNEKSFQVGYRFSYMTFLRILKQENVYVLIETKNIL